MKLIATLLTINIILIFNFSYGQDKPVLIPAVESEYNYIREFDSNLEGLKIIKVQHVKTTETYKNNVYQGTTTSKTYSLVFHGTNKAIHSSNAGLLGEYMNLYPSSKKAYMEYKSALVTCGVGFMVFLGAGITAGATYNGDRQNLFRAACITALTSLAVWPIAMVTYKNKLGKCVKLYNESIG